MHSIDTQAIPNGDVDRIVELIGVYHADGVVVGEAKCIIGKLLRVAHCALCDITHSPVRRKPARDAMVAELGVSVELVHLNEMTPDVAHLVADTGFPVVLARVTSGTLAVTQPRLCRHQVRRARPWGRPRGASRQTASRPLRQ